jgi:hypothetical protein
MIEIEFPDDTLPQRTRRPTSTVVVGAGLGTAYAAASAAWFALLIEVCGGLLR